MPNVMIPEETFLTHGSALDRHREATRGSRP